MPTLCAGFERYTVKFADWGQNNPSVRAVVVVGSQARFTSAGAPQADAWSDLDLVVFYMAPIIFNPADFGEVLISTCDPAESNWVAWKVLFADWLKIDIVLACILPPCQPESSIELILHSTAYPYIFGQGIKILYDRFPTDGVLLLPPDPPRQIDPPAEEEFLNQAGTFWLEAVHAAQRIERGENWSADQVLFNEIGHSLLRLIEWHTACVYQPAQPIGWRGRRIETWADPRAVQELADCSGKGDGPGLQAALVASCRLAEWLILEISQSLGYACPNKVKADDIAMFHVKHSGLA